MVVARVVGGRTYEVDGEGGDPRGIRREREGEGMDGCSWVRGEGGGGSEKRECWWEGRGRRWGMLQEREEERRGRGRRAWGGRAQQDSLGRIQK